MLFVVIIFAGLVDDFRIWSQARSEQEIRRYSQEALPSSPPSSLLVAYDFDEPETSTGKDLFSPAVASAARDPEGTGPPTVATIPNQGGGTSAGQRAGMLRCGDSKHRDVRMCVFPMGNERKLVCGDGRRSAQEECDDGATASGDGCSSTCTLEPGFFCLPGLPGGTDVCERGALEDEIRFETLSALGSTSAAAGAEATRWEGVHAGERVDWSGVSIPSTDARPSAGMAAASVRARFDGERGLRLFQPPLLQPVRKAGLQSSKPMDSIDDLPARANMKMWFRPDVNVTTSVVGRKVRVTRWDSAVPTECRFEAYPDANKGPLYLSSTQTEAVYETQEGEMDG